MLNRQTTLPNNMTSIEGGNTTYPSDVKLLGINQLNLPNLNEAVQKLNGSSSVEYELFISNASATQYGYLKLKGGKVVKFILLLELHVIFVRPVKTMDTKTIGYIVKYCKDVMNHATEAYISCTDFEKNKVHQHFQLPPQCTKAGKELCENLVQTLILSKEDNADFIEVGTKQGWNIYLGTYVKWKTKDFYPEILQNVIPKSIAHRETAKCRNIFIPSVQRKEQEFRRMFDESPDLKIHFLLRVSSYMLTFAGECGIYFDQVIGIKATNMAYHALLTAMYDNVNYGHGDLLVLSRDKDIDQATRCLNDAVLLVNDDTKADENQKRESGIQALHRRVINVKTDYLQIPVVVSSCATAQLRTDLLCTISGLDGYYCITPAVLTELLEWHDATMIEKISQHHTEYIAVFNRHIKELGLETPSFIPDQRMQVFQILLAVRRTYDEYFGEFFGDQTESRVSEILGRYDDVGSSQNAYILTSFGCCLNQEISCGRFHYISCTKYIVFDTETDSAIVDDDYIYFETKLIKDLAQQKLNLRSVNSLTDALGANDCLVVNDKNSRCYRFHVQSSQGEPYMLYTYGINKKLINAENRKKLDLVDLDKFLLSYSELEKTEILLLGNAPDGSYIGKDVAYQNKSNDSIFITGQSGKGKTFCASNLLPPLVMLGSRVAVFDVSKSFTHEELLRALPAEVIDSLFEFVEIGMEEGKIPVNPLYIGDCSGLPARKRRIVGFIKAATGKLNQCDAKILTGIISDMLKKDAKSPSISIEMLHSTLKSGGKTGAMVHDLISGLLNDIERIGCEDQGWSNLFDSSKKIVVFSLGDEVGDNVHALLDILISSVFEWQRDHNTDPLTLVVDEIKGQNFADGSPLHTIMTQGRKFNTKLIGITQQYISQGNHAVDVMKEAGIKIFFEPARSQDRIATELGYKSGIDAGFGSMGRGEFILSCDCYSKVDAVNEHAVIRCQTIRFVDTPLYQKFKSMYCNMEP